MSKPCEHEWCFEYWYDGSPFMYCEKCNRTTSRMDARRMTDEELDEEKRQSAEALQRHLEGRRRKDELH
jgi:uncharacterized Zn ribbon protein